MTLVIAATSEVTAGYLAWLPLAAACATGCLRALVGLAARQPIHAAVAAAGWWSLTVLLGLSPLSAAAIVAIAG